MKIGVWPVRRLAYQQRIVRPRRDQIAGVQPERQRPFASFAFALEFHRDKGGILDFDAQLFNRGDQHIAAVRFSPQYGGKQADHCLAPDWRTLMKPGSVARDPHVAVAAMVGIPFLHRREFFFGKQARNVAERQVGKVG